MPATTKTLPAIEDVDRADEKLGSFLSDLDMLVSAVAALQEEPVSLADAVFMSKAGIAVEHRPAVRIDPAAVARLLVFANELTNDAESIAAEAEKLRAALLWMYRWGVIDGRGKGG